MTSYLFDTSAIINIVKNLKDHAFELLENRYSTPLVFYELGNVVWKAVALSKKQTLLDGKLFLENIFEFLEKRIKIITPVNWSSVLDVATKLSLTFYDASYIVCAFENCLTLVTDDLKLINGIKNNNKWLNTLYSSCVNVSTSKELIL